MYTYRLLIFCSVIEMSMMTGIFLLKLILNGFISFHPACLIGNFTNLIPRDKEHPAC